MRELGLVLWKMPYRTEGIIDAPFPDGIVISLSTYPISAARLIGMIKVKVTVKNTFIEIAEDEEGPRIRLRSRRQSVATFLRTPNPGHSSDNIPKGAKTSGFALAPLAPSQARMITL